MSDHVLVIRSDSAGDVLITGPAIRAVSAGAGRVTMLCGPLGRAAADLLPGVDDIVTWRADWVSANAATPTRAHFDELFGTLADMSLDKAIIFTSRRHSPLPMALLLKYVGVPMVSGISADRAGTLLDVRMRDAGEGHEVERALRLADAAGYPLAEDDNGALGVKLPPLDADSAVHHLPSRYVVMHPRSSVAAREWSADRCAATAELLAHSGVQVVVTGSAAEWHSADRVAAVHPSIINIAGEITFGELAHVIDRADTIVVGNTGPAHLAAAVQTPVVSLFAPTIANAHWRPWHVPVVTFGDQHIACAGCRAEVCPVKGHPCLSCVEPADVAKAVLRFLDGIPTRPLQEVQ